MLFFFTTAGDCFELGRQSYNNGDYYHTVLWMQEAMDLLQEEQNRTTTTKPDILEYLAFSTYMQGRYSSDSRGMLIFSREHCPISSSHHHRPRR